MKKIRKISLSGVEVALEKNALIFKKGDKKNVLLIPEAVVLEMDKESISVKEVKERLDSGKKIDNQKALLGTYNALIRNAVNGLLTPFEKDLKLDGVGFNVRLEAGTLIFRLGYSHEIKLLVPTDLEVIIEKGGQALKLKGVNKELLGDFAHDICSLRKHNPFTNNGIHISGVVYPRKKIVKKA